MKVEFLNPFVYAGMSMLSSEAGLKTMSPGKPDLVRGHHTLSAVNVVIRVSGSVAGLVCYGMDLSVAKGIIRAMAGHEIPITDPMAESALGELGNIITGLAATSLEQAGYPCRISPPAIVKGTGVRLTPMSVAMLALPITTELGELRIFLSLTETALAGKNSRER